MARAGWLDENRFRAFPFQEGQVGQLLVGSPSIRHLPLSFLVDAGFVAGPSAAFEQGIDSIFVSSLRRTGNLVYLEVSATAAGLILTPLTFVLDLDGEMYTPVYSTVEEYADSQSLSDPETACTYAAWWGYVILGSGDDLADLISDGETWTRVGSEGVFEPSLVQNNSNTLIKSLSVGNADRTMPVPDIACGGTTPYDPGIFRAWEICLTGPVVLRPGFNMAIDQDNNTNTLTFRAAVNEGMGQPCGEVPTYPEEGEEGDDLSGALRCNDVLRSINGQGGQSFTLEANQGIFVIADPRNHRLVIDANFVNMAACVLNVSQSFFVPNDEPPDTPTTTTTTTTTTLAPLWTPLNSSYTLASFLNADGLSSYVDDDQVTTWFASAGENAVTTPGSNIVLNGVDLNGYPSVLWVLGNLKLVNFLPNSNGVFTLTMLVRPTSDVTDLIPVCDTVNRNLSLFVADVVLAAGSKSYAAGLGTMNGYWAIVTVVVNGPGAPFNVYLNDQLVFTGTAGYQFVDELIFGNNPSGGAGPFYNNTYAEIIAFYGALSTAERQKVAGYLAHRFAIQWQLAANHPYRYQPPRL